MTRLPDGVLRPGVRRVVTTRHGDLVVLLTDRTVQLRAKRSRSSGVLTLSWGQIYERGLIAETAAAARRGAIAPRRQRRRR